MTVLLDFRQVFQVLRAKTHYFDFYPAGLMGFIESCVVASQRNWASDPRSLIVDDYDDLRTTTLLNDLHMAINVRVAEAVADGKPSIQALRQIERTWPLALTVNDVVLRKMNEFTSSMGPYAVDETSFQWTHAKGLAVRLIF